MNFDDKNPELVPLGNYLVNTACVGCHTSHIYAAGGDPFSGQPMKVKAANFLAGGAVFGPFTSRNITPDKTSGNPANLTFDEFEREALISFKPSHSFFGSQ
jgi:hypothetical protein